MDSCDGTPSGYSSPALTSQGALAPLATLGFEMEPLRGKDEMRRLTLATIGVLLLAMPARAGVVQSVADRLEGKIALQADGVSVDGKKAAWADVLYLQL